MLVFQMFVQIPSITCTFLLSNFLVGSIEIVELVRDFPNHERIADETAGATKE